MASSVCISSSSATSANLEEKADMSLIGAELSQIWNVLRASTHSGQLR